MTLLVSHLMQIVAANCDFACQCCQPPNDSYDRLCNGCLEAEFEREDSRQETILTGPTLNIV